MLLLANGCSHTHGSEAFSKNKCIENTQLAYPKYVADHFDMKYENIAQPGASNEWIVKTTLDYLAAKNWSTDIFVLIGWTPFPRKSFINEHGTFFWTPGSRDPEICWQTGERHTDLINYFRSWVANDCYGPWYSEKFYHNIKYLHLVLKEKSIKHFMVNSWNPWYHHIDWQTLEVLNIPNFWLPTHQESTLYYHCKLNNCKFMPGGHPEAAGHKFYAKELIKAIEEAKIL